MSTDTPVTPDPGPRQWPLGMEESEAEARLSRMVDYARFSTRQGLLHMVPDQPFVLARLTEAGLPHLAKTWLPKFLPRPPIPARD